MVGSDVIWWPTRTTAPSEVGIYHADYPGGIPALSRDARSEIPGQLTLPGLPWGYSEYLLGYRQSPDED